MQDDRQRPGPRPAAPRWNFGGEVFAGQGVEIGGNFVCYVSVEERGGVFEGRKTLALEDGEDVEPAGIAAGRLQGKGELCWFGVRKFSKGKGGARNNSLAAGRNRGAVQR